MTADAGESTTSSVAFTFRRSGRQWLNIALFVFAIFAESTMKWRLDSRIAFSPSHFPKYGRAPQLFAYTTSAPA